VNASSASRLKRHDCRPNLFDTFGAPQRSLVPYYEAFRPEYTTRGKIRCAMALFMSYSVLGYFARRRRAG
jgi:hypothetical protein